MPEEIRANTQLTLGGVRAAHVKIDELRPGTPAELRIVTTNATVTLSFDDDLDDTSELRRFAVALIAGADRLDETRARDDLAQVNEALEGAS
jgi:hypothetical protein